MCGIFDSFRDLGARGTPLCSLLIAGWLKLEVPLFKHHLSELHETGLRL